VGFDADHSERRSCGSSGAAGIDSEDIVTDLINRAEFSVEEARKRGGDVIVLSGIPSFSRKENHVSIDVVIVAGARTPMARYTGAFSEVSAIDLALMPGKLPFRSQAWTRRSSITRFLAM